MVENLQLLILKIIKFNGDITQLLKLGYDYVQVASLIKAEIQTSNAEYINGDLFLTAKGNSLIETFEKSRQPGSETWIEPELSSKILSIKKDFIYLPNRKEFSF